MNLPNPQKNKAPKKILIDGQEFDIGEIKAASKAKTSSKETLAKLTKAAKDTIFQEEDVKEQ